MTGTSLEAATEQAVVECKPNLGHMTELILVYQTHLPVISM